MVRSVELCCHRRSNPKNEEVNIAQTIPNGQSSKVKWTAKTTKKKQNEKWTHEVASNKTCKFVFGHESKMINFYGNYDMEILCKYYHRCSYMNHKGTLAAAANAISERCSIYSRSFVRFAFIFIFSTSRCVTMYIVCFLFRRLISQFVYRFITFLFCFAMPICICYRNSFLFSFDTW